MQPSAGRTVLFAGAVCVVCAAVVSTAAVLLEDRQRRNAELEERRNVLEAAGLLENEETLDAEAVEQRFDAIAPTIVHLATGKTLPQWTADAAETPVPRNPAQIRTVPEETVVYEVRTEAGDLQRVVLPVEGQGLWSTMRGFVCLQGDLTTICGLTFHDHAETPGLGAEVDNPRWKARWVGRRAFDDAGAIRIEVARGPAGPPDADPFRVDGISGATITSRGVTHLLHFWLGEHGYGPYLDRLEEERPR